MEWILLDFETTGLDPRESEIIEIGAVKLNELEIVSEYSQLIKPKEEIPRFISQLTGITPAMVADAPSISDIMEDFGKFIGNLPIASHNNNVEQGFSDVHLSALQPKSGLNQIHDTIDVCGLVRPEAPSHSMDSLRKFFEFSNSDAHRALEDCRDLARIIQNLHEFASEDRPWIKKVAERYFGGSSSWWWMWFFNSLPDRPIPDRELLGDLRKLKKEDEEKESSPIDTKEHDVVDVFQRSQDSGLVEDRPTQIEMATRILDNFRNKSRLAIEAPTGTGKSLAYLVPGILASIDTQNPIVVSTRSKSLQDQLITKDVPRAVEMIQSDQDVEAVTVKGQENYLCLRKFNELIEEFEQLFQMGFEDGEDEYFEERYALAFISILSNLKDSVELSQISRFLTNRYAPLLEFSESVRSHHTTTIGPKCPYYKKCHFFNSARKSHQAQVIIANHSLVFQWPNHLPAIRHVVFDEAHHLENQITDVFSLNLSGEEVSRMAGKLAGKKGRDTELKSVSKFISKLNMPDRYSDSLASKQIKTFAKDVVTQLEELQEALENNQDDSQTYERHFFFEGGTPLAPDTVQRSFYSLKIAVSEISEFFNVAFELGRESEKDPLKRSRGFDLLATFQQKFEEFHLTLESLTQDTSNKVRLVYWNPSRQSWRCQISPIDVKELTHEFFDQWESCTLTSATLSGGSEKSTLLERIGFDTTKPLIQLQSPFFLQKQAKIYIPQDCPNPGTPEHLEQLVDFTEEVVLALGGRTLLLMTSNQRLRAAAEVLRERLDPQGVEVFDSLTDGRAGENFMHSKRALLIGSEKYGEGIDIPGQSLSCVIIEKINESMTRGPLAEARKSKLDFAIYDYDFPLRMVWLKQRVGRLIRTPRDLGYIAIFDPRYHRWSPKSRSYVDRAVSPIPIFTGPKVDFVKKVKSFSNLIETKGL